MKRTIKVAMSISANDERSFLAYRMIEAEILTYLAVHPTQHVVMGHLLRIDNLYSISHIATGRTVARDIAGLSAAMECARDLEFAIDWPMVNPANLDKEALGAIRDSIVASYNPEQF